MLLILHFILYLRVQIGDSLFMTSVMGYRDLHTVDISLTWLILERDSFN